MELTPIEFLQGAFSLLFVIITLVIVAKFLSIYIKKRVNEYFLLSLAWLGIANAWIPDAITFIMIIVTGNPLNPIIYFLIGFAFLPALFSCWLIVATNFAYKKGQKIILLLYFAIGLIFEIAFIYLLFNDIEQIGVHITPFQVEFGIIMVIYFIFIAVITIITGLFFSIKSLQIDDPVIKLRGKLVLIAFISFTIAVIIDAAFGSFDPIFLVFNRIILILSGVFFYMGFVLPEWTKNLFLK